MQIMLITLRCFIAIYKMNINKIKIKTLKLGCLSLSIVLLASVVYLINNNSLAGNSQQYAYAKNYIQNFPAGKPVTINISKAIPAGTGPLNITWSQIQGNQENPVIPANQTLKGPVLSFKPPILEGDNTYVFKVTLTKGKANSTNNVIVVVKGDHRPIANAGNSINVKAELFCTGNNSITTPLPILLDGSKSSDVEGPLQFEWTQLDGPQVNITDPNNATTSFKSAALCEITKDVPLLFGLTVTDSVDQKDSDNVIVIINKSNATDNIPELNATNLFQ